MGPEIAFRLRQWSNSKFTDRLHANDIISILQFALELSGYL